MAWTSATLEALQASGRRARSAVGWTIAAVFLGVWRQPRQPVPSVGQQAVEFSEQYARMREGLTIADSGRTAR
ncbi:hypothetical protein CTI14_07740 [Methylobacterium radiotolerans]|nr:hypothetical protein CTI14_07740 [Methylobacterium radiotolerans]